MNSPPDVPPEQRPATEIQPFIDYAIGDRVWVWGDAWVRGRVLPPDDNFWEPFRVAVVWPGPVGDIWSVATPRESEVVRVAADPAWNPWAVSPPPDHYGGGIFGAHDLVWVRSRTHSEPWCPALIREQRGAWLSVDLLDEPKAGFMVNRRDQLAPVCGDWAREPNHHIALMHDWRNLVPLLPMPKSMDERLSEQEAADEAAAQAAPKVSLEGHITWLAGRVTEIDGQITVARSGPRSDGPLGDVGDLVKLNDLTAHRAGLVEAWEHATGQTWSGPAPEEGLLRQESVRLPADIVAVSNGPSYRETVVYHRTWCGRLKRPVGGLWLKRDVIWRSGRNACPACKPVLDFFDEIDTRYLDEPADRET